MYMIVVLLKLFIYHQKIKIEFEEYDEHNNSVSNVGKFILIFKNNNLD